MKQFTADENGVWDGTMLRLHEHYLFSDGKTQDRDWTFTRDADGTWIGRTPDVVGVTRGTTSGNAYRMHYVFNLKSSGSDHTLTFDDWQWMVAPKIMMNRPGAPSLASSSVRSRRRSSTTRAQSFEVKSLSRLTSNVNRSLINSLERDSRFRPQRSCVNLKRSRSSGC